MSALQARLRDERAAFDSQKDPMTERLCRHSNSRRLSAWKPFAAPSRPPPARGEAPGRGLSGCMAHLPPQQAAEMVSAAEQRGSLRGVRLPAGGLKLAQPARQVGPPSGAARAARWEIVCDQQVRFGLRRWPLWCPPPAPPRPPRAHTRRGSERPSPPNAQPFAVCTQTAVLVSALALNWAAPPRPPHPAPASQHAVRIMCARFWARLRDCGAACGSWAPGTLARASLTRFGCRAPSHRASPHASQRLKRMPLGLLCWPERGLSWAEACEAAGSHGDDAAAEPNRRCFKRSSVSCLVVPPLRVSCGPCRLPP